MKYIALLYHVVDDYISRRAQFREEHLRLADEAAARGELILGGAFSDPYDTALLVFRVADTMIIERFVHNDPYFINGLVLSYEVREWNVVTGCEKK